MEVYLSGLSQSKLIARLLQWIISFSLLIIAIILILFLVKKTIVLATLLFKNSESLPSYLLLEGIITYFLYFEFIALIIKYFQSVYHFPLQYFIYIGITAVIRLIIVEHKQPISVLVYSVSILVMILALYIANTKRLIK